MFWHFIVMNFWVGQFLIGFYIALIVMFGSLRHWTYRTLLSGLIVVFSLIVKILIFMRDGRKPTESPPNDTAGVSRVEDTTPAPRNAPTTKLAAKARTSGKLFGEENGNPTIEEEKLKEVLEKNPALAELNKNKLG